MNSGIILDILLFVCSSFWSFFCFIWKKKKPVIPYTRIYILLSSLILSNPSSLPWRTATPCKSGCPFTEQSMWMAPLVLYSKLSMRLFEATVFFWVPESLRKSETSPWAIYLNYNLGLKGSANQPWLNTSNILIFRC